MSPKTVNIRFDKEVEYGLQIESHYECIKEEDSVKTRHEIRLEDQLYCEANISWKEKAATKQITKKKTGSCARLLFLILDERNQFLSQKSIVKSNQQFQPCFLTIDTVAENDPHIS
jgi:hypothetical protein